MHRITTTITGIITMSIFFILFISYAQASAIDELKDKISSRVTQINQLDDEIKETTEKINTVQSEAKTLSSSIRTLDLTRKKLLTDIEVTQNKISTAKLTIEKIQYEILQTEQNIYIDNARIINLLRTLNEAESQSLVEVLLANDELIDFWNDLENMQRVRDVVQDNIHNLEANKLILQEQESGTRIQHNELISLDSRYEDQKAIVDSNKRSKTTLLTKTQNKEESYRSLLNKKIAAKEAFEKEMSAYEAQLKIIIDSNKLPSKGSGVLAWPLPDVSLKLCSDGGGNAKNCLTQYFGNTAFSISGAYNGQGHNGVDFRAVVGTPIYASENGTIEGTGNTDQYPGCYSYGKWVLITHDNGLSSIYGHLSLIKTNPNQYVRRGDLIGYSGNTGYSTGPHLHFGVYATEGVSIVRLGDIKRITNCGDAHIPVASYNAYMNPLDYL